MTEERLSMTEERLSMTEERLSTMRPHLSGQLLPVLRLQDGVLLLEGPTETARTRDGDLAGLRVLGWILHLLPRYGSLAPLASQLPTDVYICCILYIYIFLINNNTYNFYL